MKKLSILLLVTTIVLATGCGGAQSVTGEEGYTPAELEEIAKCMTEKGAIMYGSISCPHCSDQKARFGDAIKFINYLECNAYESPEDAKICIEKGIEALPTWDLPNGERILGNHPISELTEKAGC